MTEYVVNRDKGYPIEAPTHKLFDVIELDEKAAAADVGAGYLVKVDPKNKLFTPDMARAVVEYRKEKSAAAAEVKRIADEAVKRRTDDEAAAKKRIEAAAKKPPKDDREDDVNKILAAAPASS